MKQAIIFLFVIGFLKPDFGISQAIVWDKTYGWYGDDYIYSVLKQDDGYIALGSMESRGTYCFHSNEWPEMVLIKLNNNGDLVYVNNLNCWVGGFGQICAMNKFANGNLLAAVAVSDTLNASTPYWALRLLKITPAGQVRWQLDFPNTVNWFATDICTMPDGGALIIGSKDSQTGGLEDGYALRVDSNGSELWRQFFNPSILTYPHHAEVLNGTGNGFLISGTAGARVWAAWLDSSGIVHKQHIYWQDPANTQLYNAGVMQSPDGNLVAMGSNSASGSALAWYLGKFDSLNSNVWGRIQFGGCSNMYVNTEGQIMLAFYNGNGNVFKKYATDGQEAGSVILSNDLNHPKSIKSCAWSNSDSAVFAGGVDTDRNNYRSDFYFVKMAHVGNPYITAVPAIVAEAAQPLSLYPNPATNYFKISSANPGIITLFNAAGQNVLQQSVQPSEQVSISGLPQGLYMYRFVTSKGVSSGKVVRE